MLHIEHLFNIKCRPLFTLPLLFPLLRLFLFPSPHTAHTRRHISLTHIVIFNLIEYLISLILSRSYLKALLLSWTVCITLENWRRRLFSHTCHILDIRFSTWLQVKEVNLRLTKFTQNFLKALKRHKRISIRWIRIIRIIPNNRKTNHATMWNWNGP